MRLTAALLVLAAAPVLAQQPLPDLVPVDLTVDNDCRIVVTIRNNGPAIVPNAGYSLTPPGSSGVQMYLDGAPFGGIVLGGLDPTHATQPAGGTKTYTWFPSLLLPAGVHSVKVVVDNNNSIAEINESNNSLTKRLSCQKPLPDLVPTNIALRPTGVRPNTPCAIVLTLKNNGTAPVPAAAYVPGASSVQMYKDGTPWGGNSLSGVDPTKAVQPPGGSVNYLWFGGAVTPNLLVPPGQHVMKVVVDNTNTVVESNEGNNTLTQTVTCGFIVVAKP